MSGWPVSSTAAAFAAFADVEAIGTEAASAFACAPPALAQAPSMAASNHAMAMRA
jgi:hypothetical protein